MKHESDQGDWLDPIVERAIGHAIDRLAKGREYIVSARSREVLGWVVHEVVAEVLTEVLGIVDEKVEASDAD